MSDNPRGPLPTRAASSGRNRLTPHERELDKEMLAIFEWGKRYPKRWHDIGKDEASERAAELLATRGLIEIRQPQNQYRMKAVKAEGK
jgi:hypothetical protein